MKNHPGITKVPKKNGWSYKVQIRKYKINKNFGTLKEAVEFRTQTLANHTKSSSTFMRSQDVMTLGKALGEYAEKVTPRKKGAGREINRIKAWQKHPLATKKLTEITGKDLADYRDAARASGLSEASVRIELMLLSSVFEISRKDWGHTGLNNPVKDIILPKQSNRRKRRLEEHELDYLLKAIPEAQGNQKNVREIILLAIETGMRQSEMLGIDWEDVNFTDHKIYLDETKSGDSRDVPLSAAAIEILQGMNPLKKGKVFHIIQDTLIRVFHRACEIGYRLAARDGIENSKFLADLRFHDLRHEAASRMGPHLTAHELCAAFGWKTLSMALRYYHSDASDIAKKLANMPNGLR